MEFTEIQKQNIVHDRVNPKLETQQVFDAFLTLSNPNTNYLKIV